MRAARWFRPAPTRRTSGGPARPALADRSPRASRSETRATAASGRTRERASWSATATLSASSPNPTHPSNSHARATPRAQLRLGHEGADDRGPGGQAFHGYQNLSGGVAPERVMPHPTGRAILQGPPGRRTAAGVVRVGILCHPVRRAEPTRIAVAGETRILVLCGPSGWAEPSTPGGICRAAGADLPGPVICRCFIAVTHVLQHSTATVKGP